jgi:hypothetical protein
MKTFYEQDNIGTAKYTVSYHDGIKTNRDGSPFFGIAIFKSKKKLQEFINKLLSDGYKERGLTL